MEVVEKTDFPFLRMQMLQENIKTLKRLSSLSFGAIQCDQGSSWEYQVVHACDHGKELIQKELDNLKKQEKELFRTLDEKYGIRGKDYMVTMDGSIHKITGKKAEHGKLDKD